MPTLPGIVLSAGFSAMTLSLGCGGGGGASAPTLSAAPTQDSLVASVCVATDGSVYAGGYSESSSGIAVPGYWLNGGSFKSLPPSDASQNAAVVSLAVSGSDVYAGGLNLNTNKVPVPGYWLDGAWTGFTLAGGLQGSTITSLVVSGSNVYAAGACEFTSSPGVQVPGYWLNGTWQGFTPLDASHSSFVYSLDVYSVSPPPAGLAGKPMPEAVAQAVVYAGGYSENSSGVEVPGLWAGMFWIGLTPPDVAQNSVVTSLRVAPSSVIPTARGISSPETIFPPDTNVYAAGYSLEGSPSVEVPGYWLNAGTFNPLAQLDPRKNSQVLSIAVDGSGKVYAAGFSENSSGVKVPGYWRFNGTSWAWVGLAPLDASQNSVVYSIVLGGGGTIYAGGYSTDSSGVAIPGYWKYSGTSWAWVGLTPLT